MKKVCAVLAVALVGSLIFSSTASAGLFGRLVLVDCEYTVKVPIYEEREGTCKVCTWVTDTKTIDVCVDRGEWEYYEVEVPACECRPCFGLFRKYYCGCECTKTITCKRWVPNIVTEQKEVTYCKRVVVEKPYTYKAFVGWDTETRCGKKWIRIPKCKPCYDCCPRGPAVDCGCN